MTEKHTSGVFPTAPLKPVTVANPLLDEAHRRIRDMVEAEKGSELSICHS